MRDFRKYEVWHKAHHLCLHVYQQVSVRFPAEERYSMTSQIRRAAYSVSLNIVEGCGRNTDKDFAHFLDMSLGSLQEVEYCALLAADLRYMDAPTYEILTVRINEVKAMLIGLIKTIRKDIQ
jgi:four helix bundle protein